MERLEAATSSKLLTARRHDRRAGEILYGLGLPSIHPPRQLESEAYGEYAKLFAKQEA
jgi:hypothetical protein